jgi:protein-S-isoprenylcysteine O-methyltransferase Ste14
MDSTALIVILIIGTFGIAYLSWWVSIREKRYHGIYRFFSFESIFFLILLNLPYWFKNPFSWHQILSWIFLSSSTILAFWGFSHLKKRGKPEGQFEDTTTLVTTGLYKYIRHPLYLSLLCVGFGAFFKHIDHIQIILMVTNIIALILTAKVEEKEMIKKFGNEYVEYMKTTRMFIPFIF